jgi:hypothetical protein
MNTRIDINPTRRLDQISPLLAFLVPAFPSGGDETRRGARETDAGLRASEETVPSYQRRAGASVKLTNPAFDILGFGCVAVDDLLHVASYPPADAKARVLRRDRQCGGLVVTALVAAAGQGVRCAYVAALGEDELSAFALERLRREKIDVRHVARGPAGNWAFRVGGRLSAS